MRPTNAASKAIRPRLALTVQIASRRPNLPTPARLRKWAGTACERELSATLRIVNEVEGRVLNRDYRRRDYATNVLTFVYSDAVPLSGDIVLCAPVVAREAREQGKGIEAHYAHLVIHGMLHLQGYDHEKKRAAQRMESLESALVTALGFDDPYA
jgi:probable rRNA maturation factor